MSNYWWCLHCECVYLRSSWISNSFCCPNSSCNGSYIDVWQWDEFFFDKGYPLFPSEGTCYPLYPNESIEARKAREAEEAIEEAASMKRSFDWLVLQSKRRSLQKSKSDSRFKSVELMEKRNLW